MPTAEYDLILTKLSPPLSGRGTVVRSRLIPSIADAALPKLTLITAPAGFGKTTLMSQWQTAALDAGMAAAWVSLEADDGDVRQFLSYVMGALKKADSALGRDALELLSAQASVKPQKIIGRLVNDLVVEGRSIVLFLDDYHAVDNDDVNNALSILINLAPTNFHIVLGSRNTPGLPVASLRVKGELREFTLSDLRFVNEEAQDFVKHVRGLALSNEQIKILQERTEGWVAGLQLATLFHGGTDDWNGFISAFSGTLREVADYLTVDVLNRQPADVREFLLRTSILDRINSNLSQAVTDNPFASRILAQIESQNLFILPLDKNRQWYRYHHLFGDFLFNQLKRENPDVISSLYIKASISCVEEGLPIEAVNYALKAHDYDRAAALVDEYGHTMLKTGAMPRVNEWIKRLPEEILERRPQLLLHQCWALFHMRDPENTEVLLEKAVKLFAQQRASGQTKDTMSEQRFEAELRAIKSGIAIAYDDIETTLSLAIDTFERSSGTMSWIAAAISNIRGYACLASGRFVEARAVLARARQSHKDFSASYGIVYSDCFLGMVEMAEGHLHAAAALFQQASDVAEKEGCNAPGIAVASILRGTVLYEWNKLADAEALIVPYLNLIDECGHIEAHVMGTLTMIRIMIAQDRMLDAREYLNRALVSCGAPYFKRYRILVIYEEVKNLLRQGNKSLAKMWAEESGILLTGASSCNGQSWDRVGCFQDIIRARLALADGNATEALALINPVLSAARKAGRWYRVLELLLLQSQILQTLGKERLAVASMLEALTMAEPERYMRLFLDQGNGVRDFLRDHASDFTTVGHYVKQILTMFDGGAKPLQQKVMLETEGGFLLEPLSMRESDVLRLMSVGHSNKLIAEELFIAENTVKWHIKNIFQKLGVENRTAAVLAAQNMKLIY